MCPPGNPPLALITDYLRNLRGTYWFLPSVMALTAVLLSALTLWLDANFAADWLPHDAWLYTNKPEGARAVLSTVAGSMITVAGVTFSMTIAAVSHAAGSIGPRLMGNFMRDRGNQVTLGVFIATFIYCLLILRTVRTGDTGDADDALAAFVPQISLLVTLLLALASVGVLIFFIHHVPESINVSNITARVGRELVATADDLFPAGFGDPGPAALPPGRRPEDDVPGRFHDDADLLRANRSGYLREIDDYGLLELARDEDLIVRLECRPGDFVCAGQPLARVWPPGRLTPARVPQRPRPTPDRGDASPPAVKSMAPARPEVDDENNHADADEDRDAAGTSPVVDVAEGLAAQFGGRGPLSDRCRSLFALGNERSHHQNVLFLIDELVEIAARAVSPGINDPYTAITAVDWLQTGLMCLARRDDLSPYRYDAPGSNDPASGDGGDAPRLRVIARPVTFGTALAVTFDRLTPYVAADRNVALRMMQMAEQLLPACNAAERRASVLHHARRLAEAGAQLLNLEADRDALSEALTGVVHQHDRRGSGATTPGPRGV